MLTARDQSKPPPPVPPRPSKAVVAAALARSRLTPVPLARTLLPARAGHPPEVDTSRDVVAKLETRTDIRVSITNDGNSCNKTSNGQIQQENGTHDMVPTNSLYVTKTRDVILAKSTSFSDKKNYLRKEVECKKACDLEACTPHHKSHNGVPRHGEHFSNESIQKSANAFAREIKPHKRRYAPLLPTGQHRHNDTLTQQPPQEKGIRVHKDSSCCSSGKLDETTVLVSAKAPQSVLVNGVVGDLGDNKKLSPEAPKNGALGMSLERKASPPTVCQNDASSTLEREVIPPSSKNDLRIAQEKKTQPSDFKDIIKQDTSSPNSPKDFVPSLRDPQVQQPEVADNTSSIKRQCKRPHLETSDDRLLQKGCTSSPVSKKSTSETLTEHKIQEIDKNATSGKESPSATENDVEVTLRTSNSSQIVTLKEQKIPIPVRHDYVPQSKGDSSHDSEEEVVLRNKSSFPGSKTDGNKASTLHKLGLETASPKEAPLIEDLVVELRESSQQRKDLMRQGCRIQHSDWFKEDADGQQVRYSSCHITVQDTPMNADSKASMNHLYYSLEKQHRRAMTSLQGLPPLPKSLSGINLLEQQQTELAGPRPAPASGPVPVPYRPSRAGPSHHGAPLAAPRARKPTGLDAQLAILRKEMFGLRQLDLSLLSQLWSLNESIQEFRQLLQDQEDSAALSPPSPSSADEGEEFYSPLPRYHTPGSLQLSAVPEQYHLSSSSSQSSIEYGNV